MSYPSDLTDDQWELLEPVCDAPGEHGRRPRADDLRTVVDAMLYIGRSFGVGRATAPVGARC